MESKTLTVCKEDIKKIGHTVYQDISYGGTIFKCYEQVANIEEILLRNILELYGYSIVSVDSWMDYDKVRELHVELKTNMPWEEFMSL